MVDTPEGVVIVVREAFLVRQDNYVRSNTTYSKYNTLFKEYDCFSTKLASPPPHRHHHRHHPRKVNHYNDHPPRAARDPKKMLQNLFNVLNDSNYTKILHKLKFLVSNDNLVGIVKDVLQNGVRHQTYRKHFIRLIMDLMHIWDKEVIGDTVTQYFEDFMRSQKRLPMDNTLCLNEYDLFCAQQKHKQYILNTNLLFLDAYDMFAGKIHFNMDMYLNHIIMEMNEVKNNDELIDLFLHMLGQFADRHSLRLSPYKQHILDLPVTTLSVKNRFLIEKILNNMHQ